jgi:outer membrane protein assembly factor BamB
MIKAILIILAVSNFFLINTFASAETDTNFRIKWKTEIGNETYTKSNTQDNRTTYIQAYNGFLYALDLRGQKIWRIRTDLYDNAFTRFNSIIYTGTRDGYLLALREGDGKELWQYKTNGSINSPPVISDDAVYFGSADGAVYAINIESGFKKWIFKTERGIASSPLISEEKILYFGSKDGFFYALNSENGALLWKFKTDGGIAASPFINIDTVYFCSRDERMYALNRFTGELKWQFNISSNPASAPLIYKDSISMISEDGILYGIDKEAGKEKWRIKIEKGLNINLSSSDAVLYAGADDLYAINIADGKSQWRFNEKAKELYQMELLRLKVEGEKRLTEDEKRLLRLRDFFYIDGKISSSPIIEGNDIIFATDKGYIYLVNRISGAIKWRFKTGVNSFLQPLAEKEAVYVAGDDNNIYAVNAVSGKTRWKQGLYSEIERLRIGRKALYALDNNKRLYSIDKDNGRINWSHKVEGNVNDIAVMQMLDREVIILLIDSKKIQALFDNGTERLSDIKIPNLASSYIAVDNQMLFFGSEDGNLYAIELIASEKRFAVRWQAQLEKRLTGSPVLYNDSIFSVSTDSEIIGIDKASGLLRWRHKLKGAVRPHLAASSGLIFTVLNEQSIYAIDISLNKIVWQFDAKGRLTGSPVIYNDSVFASSDSGNIYDIDIKDGFVHRELKIEDGIASQISLEGNSLFCISREGNLYALSTR